MTDTYKAEMRLPDGGVSASVTGTIQECSNWADNVIRSTGECTINIFRIEDNNCHKRCKYGKICRYDDGDEQRDPTECPMYFKLDDLMMDAEDIRREQMRSMKEYCNEDRSD